MDSGSFACLSTGHPLRVRRWPGLSPVAPWARRGRRGLSCPAWVRRRAVP